MKKYCRCGQRLVYRKTQDGEYMVCRKCNRWYDITDRVYLAKYYANSYSGRYTGD